MKDRLKERFIYIDEECLWPYLEDVINRIPEKERERLFTDKNLEIITLKERGCHISPRQSLDSLILFNWAEISKLSPLEKYYGIAHEIAHHFAGRGSTGLLEKEANDLLMKWGFEEEIKEAAHSAPIYENEGYEIGYKDAKENVSSSDLFHILSEYLESWEKDGLTNDLIGCLAGYYNMDSSIPTLLEKDPILNQTFIDSSHFRDGIRCGIMVAIRELKSKS